MDVYNFIDSLFVYSSALAIVASIIIYIGMVVNKQIKRFRGKHHVG